MLVIDLYNFNFGGTYFDVFGQMPSLLGNSKWNKVCKIWGFNGGDYEEWRILEC
jgi:hypothetical protein